MPDRKPNSRVCKGQNRLGEPCKAAPLRDSDWCAAHDPTVPDDDRFGSKVQSARAGASEKPRVPKLMEVLAQRVEEEADEIVAALFDALVASRGMTIALKGGGAEFFETPDHATRITAARELLDRVVGKPRQTTEVTGPDGGPLVLDAPADVSDRSVRAALLLAEAGLVEAAVSNSNGNGHH